MKLVLLPLSLAFLTVTGHAAVLRADVNTSPGHTAETNPVDLTATGTTNWAVWDFQTSTGAAATRAPSNTFGPVLATGTAGYISELNVIRPEGTTGNLQGSSTQGATFFTYSNGATSPSLASTKIGTAFNSTIDNAGTGMSLTVTGAPSQLYRVSIWAVGFNGRGTLTASLNGAESRSLLTQTFSNSKAGVLFTIEFQPDSATDLLNLSYTLTTDTVNGSGNNGRSSHVAIQAVTVEAIPEPSTAMALLGTLALLGIRRRRA